MKPEPDQPAAASEFHVTPSLERHYQADPGARPVIESMQPEERARLFRVAGVIIDDAIESALRGRRESLDDVGLFWERDCSCEDFVDEESGDEEPLGPHFHDLYASDLEGSDNPFELINDGFSNALDVYAHAVLDEAEKGDAKLNVQAAFASLSEIAIPRQIRIASLVYFDGISPFLSNLEAFTEATLEEDLTTADKDFKAQSASRFTAFWEEHSEYAGPGPSEEQARQLWDWYMGLVGEYCFYEPLTETPEHSA